MWGWGRNSSQNLGTGSYEYRDIPTVIDDKHTWVAVTALYEGGAAQTRDGEIFAWGDKISSTPKLVFAKQEWQPIPHKEPLPILQSSGEKTLRNTQASASSVEAELSKITPFFPKIKCIPVSAVSAKHFYCMTSINAKMESSLWRSDPFTGTLEEFRLTEDSFHFQSKTSEYKVFEIGSNFVLTTNRLRLFESGKPTMVDEVSSWVDEAAPFKDQYPVGWYPRKMTTLPDQSVIALIQNSDVVEHISVKENKLVYDRLPKLPGPKRHGVALVSLDNGLVMALGGNTYDAIGCSPCVAETYFLDLKTLTWSEGPKMTEQRADTSATLLPNGNVLVAGGWTPGHSAGGWGVLSRTVEQWDAQKNSFSKNTVKLPTGVARHRSVWSAGKHGKQLLIAGGNSSAVLAYDVENNIWRQAGEFCEGNERGNLSVLNGIINEQLLMIRQDGGTCYDSISNTVAKLRLDDGYIEPNRDVTLFRSGSAYLPGSGDQPGLVLGGSIHASSNAYHYTAAVDAIWPDGRVQALPAFNHARSGAQVFRLPDGSVILVGGHLDEGNDSLIIEKQFPAELLPGNVPLNQARWIQLEGDWGQTGQLMQLADGSLFNVTSDGNVRIIKISGTNQGRPITTVRELPEMHRVHRNESGNEHLQNITGKQLPDGRIIVAGGNVQEHIIALLQESSFKNDIPDEYIGIGDFLPSDTYEIYDPATKTWRESARSKGVGGLCAILDDGRVVRFGKKSDESFMEISGDDGNSWSALAVDKPLVRLEHDSNLFVEQGELFLAGRMDIANTNGGITSLRWFNSASRHWETIWQAEPTVNWRNYVGQIITRELSNGKVITLPVTGL